MKKPQFPNSPQCPQLRRVHTLHSSNTLEDLVETVRRLGPDILETGVPMYVLVGGYDHDARELGDIPEVRQLCQRVMDSGLASLLHLNIEERHPVAWGAIDVWAASKGLIKNFRFDLLEEDMTAFWNDLLRANDAADRALGRNSTAAEVGPGGVTAPNAEALDLRSLMDLRVHHRGSDPLSASGATKDDLATEGARWWPICFRHNKTDDEAFAAASRATAALADLEHPLDSSRLLRQVATARWCDQGFPVVQMAHTYAAALMATKLAPDVVASVRPPWRAFLLQLPNDLLPIYLGDGTCEYANLVLVRVSEQAAMAPTWNFWVFHGRGYVAYDAVSPATALEDDTLEEMGRPTDVDAPGMDNEVSRRLQIIVARLVLNACCAMTDDSANLKPLRRAAPKRTIGRQKPEAPQYRCFQLGEPVQVDCRKALQDYLSPRSHRSGSPPSVMTLVCGHRKNQAFGLRHSLRKRIWIHPYWRGADGAPIILRPHTLSDSHRSNGAAATPAESTPTSKKAS